MQPREEFPPNMRTTPPKGKFQLNLVATIVWNITTQVEKLVPLRYGFFLKNKSVKANSAIPCATDDDCPDVFPPEQYKCITNICVLI
ncbi:hypothetical protein P8452_64750 [Trifolium repens]|nr:hypothetical protein P8452_64750 [Trifolium repens]